MRICDLGPLLVEVGQQSTTVPGRRLSAVLQTLLLHLNRRVSVDLLLEAVWGPAASPSSVGTLETHVWRLRRLLEPDRPRGAAPSVLLGDSGGYRLVATPAQVDSARFEQLTLEVLDLLTTHQPTRAWQAADQALALWRGDPFSEIAGEAWAVGSIARLTELRTQLQERRIDAILAVGDVHRAVVDLEPLVAEHPFRERLWWQRMLALHRAGRTDEALDAFQVGRRTLLDELGLEPGSDLVELHRRILDRDASLRPRQDEAAGRPARPVEVRLPRSRAMLGRGADVLAVGELLQNAPLVTVAGAAGCGKTLLAIEAARRAAPQFPDGVRFVDLSATEPGDAVAEHVAAAIGLSVPVGASAEAALVGLAADQRLLLVLDNCEQLLDEMAELTEVLTAPGSQIGLLVTSREPLGVLGEQVHVIGPLPLAETAPQSALAPADEPAVALFLSRVRLAGDPDADDLATAREICRAVDGIPLAIELAAALHPTFALSEIADLVERDPGQLAAVGRGQAHHHQTLASAIERSYQLLTADEQLLHRRLAVLPGTFPASLADAVVGDRLRGRVAPLLARLAHRSLLSATASDHGTRFAQLSPVRAHARDKLLLADELDSTEELRDGWTHDLVRQRPVAGRPTEAGWYVAVEADLATVRATLQRQLHQHPDPRGAELVGQLPGLWYYLDLVEEGIRWAEAAHRHHFGSDLIGVLSRLSLADGLLKQSRADRARSLLDEALALVVPTGSGLRILPDPEPLATVPAVWLCELLLSAASSSSVVRDATLMRRLLAAVADSGLPAEHLDLAVVHGSLTVMVDLMEDPYRGDLDRIADAFEAAERRGNLLAAWLAASTGAMVGLARRDPALGLVWSRRVLDRQGRLGARTVVPQIETYGDFLALDGRLEAAVRIFAATHHQSLRTGRAWPRNQITTELLDSCRTHLDAETFDHAWAIGPTLSRERLAGEPVGAVLEPAAPS